MCSKLMKILWVWKIDHFLSGRATTFISLLLRFISEYSLEFQYGFNQNNFMYEKKTKLSQPAPFFIKISVRLSHAFYRNNINEKCVIFI